MFLTWHFRNRIFVIKSNVTRGIDYNLKQGKKEFHKARKYVGGAHLLLSSFLMCILKNLRLKSFKKKHIDTILYYNKHACIREGFTHLF